MLSSPPLIISIFTLLALMTLTNLSKQQLIVALHLPITPVRGEGHTHGVLGCAQLVQLVVGFN